VVDGILELAQECDKGISRAVSMCSRLGIGGRSPTGSSRSSITSESTVQVGPRLNTRKTP